MKDTQLQGGVTVSPTPITNGQQVVVRYNGPLANSGASAIYLHVGYEDNEKNWSNVSNLKMHYTSVGWERSFEVNGTSRLNFCFKDDVGNWDDNNGKNWSYDIQYLQ